MLYLRADVIFPLASADKLRQLMLTLLWWKKRLKGILCWGPRLEIQSVTCFIHGFLKSFAFAFVLFSMKHFATCVLHTVSESVVMSAALCRASGSCCSLWASLHMGAVLDVWSSYLLGFPWSLYLLLVFVYSTFVKVSMWTTIRASVVLQEGQAAVCLSLL